MKVRELSQLDPVKLAEILQAELVSTGENRPADGVSHDTRSLEKGDLFFAVKGDSFDGHTFIQTAFEKGAAGVVASTFSKNPAGEYRLILRVEDTVQAMGNLARHIRELRGNTVTVGITGSNGKTTSKELVTAALSLKFPAVKSPGNFNNFIGVPLSIFSMDPDAHFAVIEMGTSAAGEIAYLAGIACPDIAVVTNVGDSHLEFLKSRKGVAEEKGDLYRALKPEGTGVVNNDDEYAGFFREIIPGNVITFGLENRSDINGDVIHSDENGFILRVNDSWEYRCPLKGRHNALNVCAALAVCSAAGFDPGDFTEAFENIEIPGMRMERTTVRGIRIINDAYNANPQSMKAGFEFLREYPVSNGTRKILVCGDMKELGNAAGDLHYETGRLITAETADVLITVGSDSAEIERGACENTPHPQTVHCSSAEEAGKVLFDTAEPGDVVLIKASRSMGLETILENG